MVAGFAAFLGKYLEQQFNLTTSSANQLLGRQVIIPLKHQGRRSRLMYTNQKIKNYHDNLCTMQEPVLSKMTVNVLGKQPRLSLLRYDGYPLCLSGYFPRRAAG